MAKPLWDRISDALNEIGIYIYIYIDKAVAILYCQVPSNDIRRIIINFIRLEIRSAKLFEYILTECMLIKRVTTLASIFKELKFQSSIWANIFYYLSGLQIRKRVYPRIYYNNLFPDGQQESARSLDLTEPDEVEIIDDAGNLIPMDTTPNPPPHPPQPHLFTHHHPLQSTMTLRIPNLR